MIVAQLLVILIILPISYGPLGELTLRHGGPDLFLVATWLFAWLTDRTNALRWAVIAGLALDLLNFQRFGFWTFQLVGLAILVDYVRGRYFQVSSLAEALLALLVMTLISLLIQSLMTQQFIWPVWLIEISSNVLLGTIMYYILAVRFRLFQRWFGQRL